MSNVPERPPAPDRLTQFRVGQAKKLLADIATMDFDNERDAYTLLGRTEFVLAALVEIIDGGEQL